MTTATLLSFPSIAPKAIDLVDLENAVVDAVQAAAHCLGVVRSASAMTFASEQMDQLAEAA